MDSPTHKLDRTPKRGRVWRRIGFAVGAAALLILAMFPVLLIVYVRLAKREETDALAEFGDAYARYAAISTSACCLARSTTRSRGGCANATGLWETQAKPPDEIPPGNRERKPLRRKGLGHDANHDLW